MELVVRKNDLLKELVPSARHRRAEEHDSDSRERAARGDEGRRVAAGDGSRCRFAQPVRPRRSAKPGTLTLPAKKLFEIVSALPETDIRIEEDKGGKSVTVAADRFESRMQTLPASEFPTPPQDGGETEATLPGAALKRMISHTRFAITSEDTRYFLNGAQLVLRPDSMSMVATDGHRLAFISVHESPGKGVKSDVLLPRKTLNEVARLIDGGERRGVLAGRESPVLPRRRPAC